MKKRRLPNNIPQLIAISIDVLLFVAVVFLMGYVQNLLNSDIRINLTEVVTQNKDVINSKLMLEVNSLDLVSSQISDQLEKEGYDAQDGAAALKDAIQKIYADGASSGKFSDCMFVATSAGEALFASGESYDIFGRRYFQLALEGNQNISDRLVSRRDGADMFIISVPLYDRGAIIGTVQQLYTPEEMYQLCSISLFSSQGFMYIINSDGYILVSSRDQAYSQETDNLFRSLFAQGNKSASQQLEADVENNTAGFMEITSEGHKVFCAYTPIENIHDWYLISCVATEAVSPNGKIVIKLFYSILSAVILVLGATMLLFLAYKNKQQAKLRRLAFIDTVTQGDTFNKFTDDLQEKLAAEPEKSRYLVAFDIDNFKYVNNYYGFESGDRILYQLNASISAQLFPGEQIARISGDHFVMLLENVAPERLNALLDWTRTEDGIIIYLSAGLYQITNPSENINLMLDKASTAAHAAKGVFHKRVEYYSEKFDQQIFRNEQMKRAVQNALADDEFVPFFQPKVNVNSGELVGAEALARWRTKDGKLVSPGEFIPVCEQTGLVVELDMMIFEKTLRFLRENLDAGVHCVPISINFSRLHLSDKNFIEGIVEKLTAYQVPPELIEVELTESVIFENYEIIAQFADKLHQSGVLISMDDFGSGYSSLNLLKDIPIDVLKIDRAFLEETTNVDKQRIILSTIAQMAEKLCIHVVVEGVETQQNVEMMQEFGCYVAQGYYFAKPMDESKFETIFKEGALC